MVFGGLEKLTLIDYPGKVACIVYTIGCNFRCPYCHNPDLVNETVETKLSEQEILDFLESRKAMFDALVITGGEPTMHADLPEFIKKVKALGYAVKLDTNGTNPEMLKSLVSYGLIDYAAMDIKAPLAKYASTVGAAVNRDAIAESISFLLAGAVPYEFRTTVVRSQLSSEDLMTIGQEIRGAENYYLQQFNPATALHPSFRSKLSYETAELEAFAHLLTAYVTHCSVRT
jgi:pyruvate formate lyase activating enzyme